MHWPRGQKVKVRQLRETVTVACLLVPMSSILNTHMPLCYLRLLPAWVCTSIRLPMFPSCKLCKGLVLPYTLDLSSKTHWATRWCHSFLLDTSSSTSSQATPTSFKSPHTVSCQCLHGLPGFFLALSMYSTVLVLESRCLPFSECFLTILVSFLLLLVRTVSKQNKQWRSALQLLAPVAVQHLTSVY